MKCIIGDCHRRPDRGKECSHHMRKRLYGDCISCHNTPAQAKHGFCYPCLRRGGPPTQIKPGLLINNESQRYCWSCKGTKNIWLFPKSTAAPFGHAGMCKTCLIERNRGYNPVEVFSYAEKHVLQGVSCSKCRSIEELEVDHILPVSKGGGNDMENLQILCSTCNKRKRNFEAVDYRIMV